MLAPRLQLQSDTKSSGKNTLSCLRRGDCLRMVTTCMSTGCSSSRIALNFCPEERDPLRPGGQAASAERCQSPVWKHSSAVAREQHHAEQLPSTSLTARRPCNSHPSLGQGVPTPSPTPGLWLAAASEGKMRKVRSSSLCSCIGEVAAVTKPQHGGN